MIGRWIRTSDVNVNVNMKVDRTVECNEPGLLRGPETMRQR